MEGENSDLELEELNQNGDVDTVSIQKQSSKPPKKGIIYLSTIPPYMDVTRIREYFEEFGKVLRVYLQLGDQSKDFFKGQQQISFNYFQKEKMEKRNQKGNLEKSLWKVG